MTFCPFADDGCDCEGQKCRFWGPQKGCDIDNAIQAIKKLPNLLKLIREALEEGKHIKE